MFKNAQAYRSFLTVVATYTLDTIGFSIVFPVLAPLLLNPHLHFFGVGTVEMTKTTILGLLFAAFGIAQFIGAPIAGALADHYGRYKVFLGTIGLSILGYSIMAVSIYEESLIALFIGRIITGFCSGNISLAQSATADLSTEKYRGKAFGILLGIGGLGFVFGPFIGGKLANPDWLFGSGAFIFAAIASLLNFFMVFFFFKESWKPSKEHLELGLLSTIKDIGLVFHNRTLRIILISQLFFLIGWAFFLVFSPTFLVQKFSLSSEIIGDFFAYMAITWTFAAMYLNKALTTQFSLRPLILVGLVISAVTLGLFVAPQNLWPYWGIIPLNQLGGALCFINLGTLLSLAAPKNMQGRTMGVGGSMWSFGQIIAPLIAGPLAGWNMYAPLLVGACSILISFVYFLVFYKRPLA